MWAEKIAKIGGKSPLNIYRVKILVYLCAENIATIGGKISLNVCRVKIFINMCAQKKSPNVGGGTHWMFTGLKCLYT